MLLCDDLGLGKSLTAALALFNPALRPGLIVCQTHLPHQWKCDVIEKFTGMSAYIIPVGKLHNLPPADIYIISYSKISKWAHVLEKTIKSIIWDEVQELRCRSNGAGMTQKYASAKFLNSKVEYAIGLSGTPIYNYAIELWNIYDNLKEGCVGQLMGWGLLS